MTHYTWLGYDAVQRASVIKISDDTIRPLHTIAKRLYANVTGEEPNPNVNNGLIGLELALAALEGMEREEMVKWVLDQLGANAKRRQDMIMKGDPDHPNPWPGLSDYIDDVVPRDHTPGIIIETDSAPGTPVPGMEWITEGDFSIEEEE